MLPFVYINVASSADGKLAPPNRHFVPFGSRQDQRLLLELRAGADAVMAGARTVDLMPVDLGPGAKHYRQLRKARGLSEYNLRVVVSGNGSLNPDAEIFKRRFSPVIVLTCAKAPKRNLQRLRQVADAVEVFGDQELDFTAALGWLAHCWKVKRLLCEGGGVINASLFRAGLVREVYLTLCPLVIGGQGAPTMADGPGIQNLRQAARLRLKSLKRLGSELFLVYRVVHQRR